MSEIVVGEYLVCSVYCRCNTGINIAWLGTDVQESAFTTGPQIQRLNSLSIVSLYYTVKDYVMSTVRDFVEPLR